MITDNQKQIFLQALAAQFKTIFAASKRREDNQTERFRTQGFIHAGELMGICSRSEINDTMEQAHLDIFGCSVAERKPTETQRRRQALKFGDYDYFDEPAINRMAIDNQQT